MSLAGPRQPLCARRTDGSVRERGSPRLPRTSVRGQVLTRGTPPRLEGCRPASRGLSLTLMTCWESTYASATGRSRRPHRGRAPRPAHGGRGVDHEDVLLIEPTSRIPAVSTNADFDLFRTTEDHEALREAVRAVAEDKIAPYAAAVDEEARYPQEAHDALVASDFFAPARARGVRRRRRRRPRDLHRHRGGRPGRRVRLAHPGGQQARLAAAHPRRQRRRQAPLPHAARRRAGRRSPTACPSARPAPTPRR